MSWKKSWLFFAWQSLRYATSFDQFTRHWSYFRAWESSFQVGRNSVSDELPWLNFPAVDFLKTIVRPGIQVFEYGGGGSTIFFCKQGATVSTVEDNEAWFRILEKTIAEKGYPHWTGMFIQPEPFADAGVRRSPANPHDFVSATPSAAGMSFEKYARSIDRYPTAFFDLVLVDGRARPSCIQQAIPHLKIGGLLVIDNTERDYYLTHFQALLRETFAVEQHQMAPVAYTPDFTRTTILQKLR